MTTQDLGAVTGTAVVSHTYQTSGTFTLTATLTDAAGNRVPVSTVVFVQVSPPLGVSLSSTQSVSGINTLVSFTATVTGLGTTVVVNYHWDWGDGTPAEDTTSNQNTHTYVTAGLPKIATVTITTSTNATKSVTRTIS